MNEQLALESFINFCDDMQIAEEGLKGIGNAILHGIDKVIEALKIALNNLNQFITGLRKKRTLHVTNVTKELLNTIVETYSDAYEVLNEFDPELINDMQNMGVIQRTVQICENICDDTGDKLDNMNKSGERFGELIELPAAPYVEVAQKAIKLNQKFYKIITESKGKIRSTDNKEDIAGFKFDLLAAKESIKLNNAVIRILKCMMMTHTGLKGKLVAKIESKVFDKEQD